MTKTGVEETLLHLPDNPSAPGQGRDEMPSLDMTLNHLPLGTEVVAAAEPDHFGVPCRLLYV